LLSVLGFVLRASKSPAIWAMTLVVPFVFSVSDSVSWVELWLWSSCFCFHSCWDYKPVSPHPDIIYFLNTVFWWVKATVILV
jgi:hypothetical protein